MLCFAGAALTVASGALAVMAAGRLVSGLGAESLIVAVTTAIAKWFRGKELFMMYGSLLLVPVAPLSLGGEDVFLFEAPRARVPGGGPLAPPVRGAYRDYASRTPADSRREESGRRSRAR